MREKAREHRPSDSESLVLLLWAVCRVCVCVCVCVAMVSFSPMVGTRMHSCLFLRKMHATFDLRGA
jgi:hypothetical protein